MKLMPQYKLLNIPWDNNHLNSGQLMDGWHNFFH